MQLLKLKFFALFYRMSTSSQTSDLGGDKKIKGLKGMLTKIKKSISIEDSNTGGSIRDVGVKVLITIYVYYA